MQTNSNTFQHFSFGSSFPRAINILFKRNSPILWFNNNPCKFIMHLVCIRFCKLCELKQSPSSDCMIVHSQWHDAHNGQARHVTGTSKIKFCTRYIKSDICHIGYFVPSMLRKILFHLLHCTTSLSGTVA